MADLFSLICGYSEDIQYFHFAIPPKLSGYTLHFGDQGTYPATKPPPLPGSGKSLYFCEQERFSAWSIL